MGINTFDMGGCQNPWQKHAPNKNLNSYTFPALDPPFTTEELAQRQNELLQAMLYESMSEVARSAIMASYNSLTAALKKWGTRHIDTQPKPQLYKNGLGAKKTVKENQVTTRWKDLPGSGHRFGPRSNYVIVDIYTWLVIPKPVWIANKLAMELAKTEAMKQGMKLAKVGANWTLTGVK